MSDIRYTKRAQRTYTSFSPESWTFEKDGRRYYNRFTLRRACRAFERAYGVSSEEALRRHVAGEVIHPDLTQFDRGVWMSFWREAQ